MFPIFFCSDEASGRMEIERLQKEREAAWREKVNTPVYTLGMGGGLLAKTIVCRCIEAQYCDCGSDVGAEVTHHSIS